MREKSGIPGPDGTVLPETERPHPYTGDRSNSHGVVLDRCPALESPFGNAAVILAVHEHSVKPNQSPHVDPPVPSIYINPLRA